MADKSNQEDITGMRRNERPTYVGPPSVPPGATRKAFDRLVTCVVTTAFAVAMVPLVSLVWTVLSRGLKRLDAEFFGSSMLVVVSE